MNHTQEILNFGADHNKILLIDVDSKIPNLALMKLSTYYKKQGFSVEFIRLGFNGYPSNSKAVAIQASEFSEVFASNIFTVNQEKFKVVGCDKVHIGGVGSKNMNLKLLDAVDGQDLDYSLYPDNKVNWGFISRGCGRRCTFCLVPKNEGLLRWDKTIDEITKYGFKKTSFMDNNFLMIDGHKDILREILDKDLRCEFNQGLDFRCVDDENLEMLAALKYTSAYTFAFDFPQMKKYITRKFALIKKYISKDWACRVYIYHNHKDYTLEQTAMRINWCRDNRVLPYFMRDVNCFDDDIKLTYSMLGAWCNQPSFFKKMPIKDFIEKRSNRSIEENIARGLNPKILKLF